MDWSKGFSAKYYGTFVEVTTWRDIGRFEITSGTVKRTDEGLYNSADIDCKDYTETTERWIRVYMDVSQDGESSHIPLFTGLATAPSKSINGSVVSNSLECYSVLQPAQDVILPQGYYAMKGTSGADIVKKLLQSVTPAPITVEGVSPALSQHIIAESNETNLSMAAKVLSAINWRLRIDGHGDITVCSQANTSVATFDPIENDSIEPELDAVNDWYECPNVFMAISGGVYAVAKDEDIGSPLSIINRGREVWQQETNASLNEDETVAEYAQRRLKELQQHYLAVSYTRRFNPDVVASDVITLHYPQQGLDGYFYVGSQNIELGHGATTDEEVTQVETK